jgi:putative ATPase
VTGNNPPLADQLRPQKLADFIGQEHLVGNNGVIRKLIESDQLPSMIFWGPPGSGKTSLAQVIAKMTKSHFINSSAVTTTLKDVRQVVKEAGERLSLYNQKTIFFLDEIHRFNKAQQDAFLPQVEKGIIILVGATTENPSFEVIGPLLSRCRVFVLNQLSLKELRIICRKGLRKIRRRIEPKALDFMLEASNGDARIALNAIEIACSINKAAELISLQLIKDVFQKQTLLYDTAGEEHYNTISAFIKSMRASDADAALYYLAKMIEAGEDPLFIARRMVVFASEDIGMAQPTALVVANDVFRACETIGYPECQENLAHGVVYLALAKKDRSAYDAYMKALTDVKKYGNLPIPMSIRNAPTKLMKDLGYGKDYDKYTKESLLPEKIKNRSYYVPKMKNKL